jgi:hypothetical protein
MKYEYLEHCMQDLNRLDYYGEAWARSNYYSLTGAEREELHRRDSLIPYEHLYDFSALSIGDRVQGVLNGKYGTVDNIDERFYAVRDDDGEMHYYYPNQIKREPDTSKYGIHENINLEAQW